ncbi:MAG: YceI family protein [Gammaproteobacteria bacterium]
MYRATFIAVAVAVSLFTGSSAFAATYKIDSAHSFPQFEIRHLSFSLLHGQFNHTTGTITMNRAKKLGSVQVTIAVDSIDTGYAQRNKDLLAPSFFNAAKYPTMTYRSTKVVYNGKDAATVYGKLTLKGTTKPVTLHVSRIHCAKNPFGAGERCGFDATTDIKRSNFGVSGDLPVVPNAVHIVINVDAVSESMKKGE